MPGGLSGYLEFKERAAFGVVTSATSSVVTCKSGAFVFTAAWSDIIVWKIETETEHCRFSIATDDIERIAKQRPFVTSLLLTDDELTLIAGYSDGRIRLWNIATQESECVLHGHKGPVLTLALQCTPNATSDLSTADELGDELLLVSGGNDTDIILWDLLSRRGLIRLKGHHKPVTGLKLLVVDNNSDALTADKSVDQKSQLKKDSKSAKSSKADSSKVELELDTAQEMEQLLPSEKRRYVISCSRDCSLKVWDVTDTREGGLCVQTAVGHKNQVWAIGYDCDSRVVVSGAAHMEMLVWLFVPVQMDAVKHTSDIDSMADGMHVDDSSTFEPLATALDSRRSKLPSIEWRLKKVGNLSCGAYLAGGGSADIGEEQKMAASSEETEEWASKKARISQLRIDSEHGLLYVLCNDSPNIGLFRMRTADGIQRKMKTRLSKMERKQLLKMAASSVGDDSSVEAQLSGVQIKVSDIFCELTPLRTPSRLHSMDIAATCISMAASSRKRGRQRGLSVAAKDSVMSDGTVLADAIDSGIDDALTETDASSVTSAASTGVLADDSDDADEDILSGQSALELLRRRVNECESIASSAEVVVKRVVCVFKNNTLGVSYLCVPNWSALKMAKKMDGSKQATDDGEIKKKKKVKASALTREALLSDRRLVEYVSIYESLQMGRGLGHRNAVRALALSGDSSMIASVSKNEVKVWNTRRQHCIRSFTGGEQVPGFPLQCAFVSPANKHLLVATKEGLLLLYDLVANELCAQIKAHSGPLYSLQLTQAAMGGGSAVGGGERKQRPVTVVTGGGDCCVKLWEFELQTTGGGAEKRQRLTLALTRSVKFQEQVLCCRVSGDGQWLAVSLLDSTIQVFRYQSLKYYLTLFGHKLPCFSIDISADSSTLVSASMDKNVKLWGLRFGDCLKSMFAHKDSIMNVAFLPFDEKALATAKKDEEESGEIRKAPLRFVTTSKAGDIKYWCGQKFKKIQEMRLSHIGEVWALAVPPSALRGALPLFVTAGSDRSIRVFVESQTDVILPQFAETDEMQAVIDSQLVSEMDTMRRPTAVKGSGLLVDFTERALREKTAVKSLSCMDSAEILIDLIEKKASTQSVLSQLKKVSNAQLSEVLLVLPFKCVRSLLCEHLVKTKEWRRAAVSEERVFRTVTGLIRVHYRMMLASSDERFRAALEKLFLHLKKWLQEYRQMVDFNIETIDFLQATQHQKADAVFSEKMRDKPVIALAKRKKDMPEAFVTHGTGHSL